MSKKGKGQGAILKERKKEERKKRKEKRKRKKDLCKARELAERDNNQD